MKQFYAFFSGRKPAKTFLLSSFFLFAFYLAGAQTYYTTLSGPAEAPPNNSPGTGKAVLTIAGNTMTIQVTFSGLLGTTTASHIHAPTAVPRAGAAGVATQLPTFVGFPLGVNAGTYTHTFDMLQPSSYNPSYVTANGGVANAFAALKASLNEGRAYLNIHTTLFPGGEIRGFFSLCPNITVTIPDVSALPKGVLPNTVYPAYAPASSLMLNATASGGTGPYTYSWSTGSTDAGITVQPTTNTTYNVTVRDQNGCPGSASKTVAVVDVSGGKNDNKIVICHKGNTQTIAAPAVSAHLEHGDMLGSCSQSGRTVSVQRPGINQLAEAFSVQVRANPSSSHFELQLSGERGNNLQLRVMDLSGRVVESRTAVQPNQSLRIGMSYNPGVYLVQVVQGAQVKTLRLIKSR